MSERLFLQCDVQRLPAHEAPPTAELVLALAWQFGWLEDFDPANPAHVELALPWTWSDVGEVRLCFVVNGVPLPLITAGVLNAAGFALGADRPRAVAALERVVNDTLLPVGRAGFEFDLDNPDALMPDEGHILQLQAATARTAAGLGFGLNLAAVVEVPVGDLPPSAWDPAAHRMRANVQLFAVPVLARTGVAYSPESGGPTPLGSGVRFQWRYNRTGAGPALVAVAVPVDDRDDPADAYVQLRTGWVRRRLVAETGTHWPTAVADRVAEAWDLPRLLLDAVRDYASIPTADVYWRLVVAALRDRAGLGLIDTPDGEGLLKYAVQLAAPLEPGDIRLVRDGQLRSLQAKLRAYERTSLARPPLDPYGEWYAALRDVNADLPDFYVTVAWPMGVGDPLLTAPSPTFELFWSPGPADAPTASFANIVGTLTGGDQRPVTLTVSLYQAAVAVPIRRGYVHVVGRRPANPDLTSDRREVVPPGAASRLVTVVWPAGGTLTAATRFDLLWSADEIGTAPLTFNDVRGTIDLTPEGRGAFTFDLHQPAIDRPVRQGWVQASATVPPFPPTLSERLNLPPGLPTFLAPLARLHTDLRDRGTLARLIRPAWAGHAAHGVQVGHATGAGVVSSPPWFDTVRTTVDSAGVVSVAGVGDVRAFDGRVWVVTVPSVRWDPQGAGTVPWPDGRRALLEFAAVYDPDGTVPAGTEAMYVELTWQDTGTRKVRVAWRRRDGGGTLGPVLAQATLPNSTEAPREPFHVRIEWSRGAVGLDQLRGAAFVGFGAAGAITWHVGPVATINAAMAFARLGLRVQNPEVAAPNLLTDAPSLLTAPRSLADPRPDIVALQTAWYSMLDPAYELWKKADAPRPTAPGTELEAVLASIDSGELLAAGQTARLMPVWNHRTPDFQAFINRKFGDLLKLLPAQRFGRPPAARAEGIYRDFLPAADAVSLDNRVWTLIDDRLADEARRVPWLVAAPPARPYQQTDEDRETRPALHAVNIQVIEPATFDGSATVQDEFAAVSGFGMLVRQADPTVLPMPGDDEDAYLTDQPWRLLDLADLGAYDPAAPAQSDEGSPYAHYLPPIASYRRRPVPFPLGFEDGARQTVVPYRGHHIGIVSPLTELGDVYNFGTDGTGESETPFQRQQPSPPAFGHDWGLLPTRKFGQWYQALAFVFRNGAALPKALAGSHPASLRPDSPTDSDLGADVTDELRRFVYLRRVGVSAPRTFAVNPLIAQASEALRRPALNPLPRDVLPLARDWNIRGLSALQPEHHYFYDASRLEGDIVAPSRWEVVLPRVLCAGGEEGDHRQAGAATAAAKFSLWVGLENAGNACGLDVARDEGQLAVAAASGTTTVELTTPDGRPLTAGAIDLRVTYAVGSATLAYRRADRDEPWVTAATVGGLVLPAGKYGLTVRRLGAAAVVTTRAVVPAPATEVALTYGLPEFAVAGPADAMLVPRSGLNDMPAVAVIKPAPIPAGLPATAAEVLQNWSAAPNDWNVWVRLPSVDLDVWTAWIDMDRKLPASQLPAGVVALTDAQRERIWVEHTLRKNAQDDTGDRGEPDDPAANLLVLELKPLHVNRAEQVWRIGWQPDVDLNASNPLRLVQHAARRLAIGVVPKVDSPTAAAALAGTSVTAEQVRVELSAQRLTVGGDHELRVLLQEQEIWELSVYPAVRERYFAAAASPGLQRFHSEFGGKIKVVYDPGGAGSTPEVYRLFTPWRAVLEVATPEVVMPAVPQPTPEQQRAAARKTLLDTINPRFDGRHVRVELRKPDPRTYRYASEVRLLRQVWRWRGRPVPPFPFAAAAAARLDEFPSAADDYDAPAWPMVWDAAGFGDRSSVDMLDETKALSTTNAGATLFAEDLANDRRALYYRFAAQARSRYAPLFPEVPPLESSELEYWRPRANDVQPNANAWRRLFVPSRWEDDLPRPAVRFVIPLTETDDVGRGACGQLVTLDDTGFAYAGLAETFEAEIVDVADHYRDQPSSTGDPVTRPEFGPDPTLSPGGWTRRAVEQNGQGDDPPARVLSMQVIGPIGHTFDTDAEAPLYNASSFILRPPTAAGVDDTNEVIDLSWYFAKVRFRRVILPEAAADYRLTAQVPISGTVPTDLILPANRPWVIDCPRIRVTYTARDDLAVAITDELQLPANGPVPRGSRGTVRLAVSAGKLKLTWTPDPLNPVDPPGSPVAAVEIASDEWGTIEVDIRFVLTLDARVEPPGAAGAPKPQPRHTAITYRVRQAAGPARLAVVAGVWHRLASWSWASSDPAAWPNRVMYTAAAGTPAASTPLAFPLRASPFTPPQWIQFLPDSQRLRERLVPDDPDARLGLRWLDGTKRCEVRRGTPDESVTAALAAVARRDVTGGDVAFLTGVLVTEVVADVRGQAGQERYVGLYRYRSVEADLERVHPSLVGPDVPEPASLRLRVRLVEFQVFAPDRVFSRDQKFVSWDDLFPPRLDRADGDTPARVVRVTAPVDLATV